MGRFLTTVFGTVVGIFMFFVVLLLLTVVIGLAGSIGAAFKPAETYVLTLDLRDPLRDHDSGRSIFGDPPPSVVGIVQKLHAAGDDPDVKGLLIRANEYGMVPASAEEIRLAIEDFKTSGKFVITHAQGFEGTSFTAYMAVSASDEIWQQGATSFSVAGIHSEVGFYRGILDKIEAEPQIEQFHEYKSAANAYMETGFTDSHREATLSLLDSLYLTAVENIALDRGLTPSAVKTAFTDAPHTAEEASALGFVDEIGYYLDARDYARDKAGGGSVRFDSVHSYSVTPDFSAPVIAFVGGQGSVVNGESRDGSNPLSSSVTMGGDTVSQAINDAAMDESVKAILFRVSTPGGSATASDQIHDAVQRARDAGKPVIVSMGQYAASGGYYVSANADHIVALPGTITGSIGVLGGKIAFEDSYAMIGYNVEQLDVGGDFVSAFSVDVPFTESQRLAFRARLEDIYNGFVSRVAEGRNMSVNQVGKVAKGRVWTGVQALEHGLVDEQGGLMTAIAAARRLAGIDEDSGVRLKMFPRPKSATEQLEEILGSAVSARQDLDLLREVAALPEVRAVIDARAGLEPGQELLADIPDIE